MEAALGENSIIYTVFACVLLILTNLHRVLLEHLVTKITRMYVVVVVQVEFFLKRQIAYNAS